MSKKDGILDLPIKKEWFDKIRSGEKTHEYRRVCPHWCSNIGIESNNLYNVDKFRKVKIARLRCGQIVKSTNKEKTMLFEIKSISCIDGIETDLKYKGFVFDIELGRRLS